MNETTNKTKQKVVREKKALPFTSLTRFLGNKNNAKTNDDNNNNIQARIFGWPSTCFKWHNLFVLSDAQYHAIRCFEIDKPETLNEFAGMFVCLFVFFFLFCLFVC